MSAITPEGLSPYDESSTDEKVDALMEVVREQSEAIEELQRESEQKDERIAELEEQLSEQQSESARERAEIKQRVTALESEESDEEPDSNDETPTPEPEETTIHKPETALEDIVQLPEHLAEENLSANQQRARFVARDAHEYTRSVPAGRVIKSSELRRVLSAGEDGTVYSQTVSRVIDYLDSLGDEDVKIRETQAGERVVVFSDEIVKRIVAYHNRNNGVVTGGKVEG
jgi:cell division septum initiation protein DivIVA